MPALIDQSGGMYSMASQAGTATGKARGTTMNGWDAATMAITPLLANMASERDRKARQAEAEKFLDEAFRADPEEAMFGQAERGYLAGLAHGGADVKHISQTAQALLAKRMQAERDRNLNANKQTDLGIKDRAQRAKELAQFGGAGPGGQPIEGQSLINSRRANTDEARAAESARHNAAGEGLGRDRLNQSDRQFNDRMDRGASEFDRRMDDSERRTDLMANRPQGGGETQEQTEFAQIEMDYKDAQRHTAEVRKMLQDSPGDESVLRSLRSARTAERELFNELRAARGRVGDSKRGAKAPAAPQAAPRGDDFQATYDALPSGAEYTDPSGNKRRKR